MRKLYNIKVETYPLAFRIHIGSVDELNEYRKKRELNPLRSKMNACLMVYEDGGCGEFFIPFDTKNEVIVHEAVHAALFTFNEIGQNVHTSVDNEYLPYLVEWFFMKIEEAVEKYIKANEKNV